MEKIELNAKKRDKKESVKKLRNNNFIPAVIYGPYISPLSVTVNYADFEKVYRQTGSSRIFELLIDKKEKRNVLVQDIQKDPIKDTFIHIDFHAIRMDEKITANIPIKYEGVSPAVKDKSGVLVKNIDELEIECLPKDLPREFLVDIAILKDLNSAIRIKDLKGYENVKINANLNDVIVTVAPPRTEKELASLEEKVEEKVEEVEGVKKAEKVEEGEEKDEKKDEKAK